MRRVLLSERDAVVRPVAGRLAAVALPVVEHPEHGECLVVTRRSAINGHTGMRMSHAGDVVLFGGSLEPGETFEQAAVRELCEESGTLHLLDDPRVRVLERLGTWTTESGFVVEGFLVEVPPEFVTTAAPEPREVAAMAYLRADDVRSAGSRPELHHVHSADHQLEGEAEFESPTIYVAEPDTAEIWDLWGAAGYMVSAWQVLHAQP